MRKASGHYSARALEILTNLDDPAAETWVFTLLGLSKFGEGRWEESRTFLANVVAAATRIGDRRRWRDGVENAADIEACRGNWKEALVGLNAVFEAAKQDKDQRYMVMACRERTYCNLQLGDLDAVDASLLWIKGELERDLGTEELPTRLDFHAFAATVALERGDFAQAAREADAGMKAIVEISGKSTSSYHVLVHVSDRPRFRQFMDRGDAQRLNRSWTPEGHGGGLPRAFHPGLVVSNRRAIGGYRPRLPRAVPRPHGNRDARCWRRAAANANRLDMSYEAQLALRALGEARGRTAEAGGLPFLIGEGVEGCRMNRTLFFSGVSRTPSGVLTRTSRLRFP